MTLLKLKTGMEHSLTPPVSERQEGEITPALSPDGRRLVFQRRTLAVQGDLFLVDLKPDYTAAGPPRQLTHEGCSTISSGKNITFLGYAPFHVEQGPGSQGWDPVLGQTYHCEISLDGATFPHNGGFSLGFPIGASTSTFKGNNIMKFLRFIKSN